MNGENNFNNQFNGGLNNQVPQQSGPNPQNNQEQSFNNFNGMQGNIAGQANGFNNQMPQQPGPNPQNNQEQSFNNFNGMQGNMMDQTNGFNNQMPQQPNSNMPVNNFGQQQQGQFQNGPMPMGNQFNNNNGQQKKSNTGKIICIAVGAFVVLGIAYTFLGGKTLTCTRHDSFSGVSYEDTIKVKFRDDKIKRIEQTGTIDLGSNISKKDEFIDAIKEDYEEEKTDGLSYSISSKDSKVTFKVTASSKDAIEKFYYLDEDASYDSVKSELIADKYTCK